MKNTHEKAHEHTKIVVIVSAAAALLTPLSALADTPFTDAGKTDTQIRNLLSAPPTSGSCAVIASVDGDLSPVQTAQMTALGADITRHLGFIHSVALTLPTRNLNRLAALPFVKHLSYDGVVKKYDAFTDASSGAAYARQNYGLTGKGVTVAVVDSGIDWHWDLMDANNASRTISQVSFISSPDSGGNFDLCGHGSHVAGIIAGNGTASTGVLCSHTFVGIAPQATLVSTRVLDQDGASTVSAVLAGLQWVVANKNTYNIRVMNLSLGHPVNESYKTDPLCQAVETAWKSGIVVVCTAGNNGRMSAVSSSGLDNEGWGTAYGSIQSPANDPYVITVGATKSMDGIRGDDRIATYSSRGPSRLDLTLKPDIVAPGNKVVSLDVDYSTLNYAYAATNLLPYNAYTTITPTTNIGSLYGNNRASAGYSNAYFVLSGTSMAAPVVAGAAALMLEKDSTLTPDAIKARLMVSADKWANFIGTYEAEAPTNTLTGTAYVSSSCCFSNNADVHNVGSGSTLQFNGISAPSAGSYILTVAYVNGDAGPRTAFVSVNGGSPKTVSFPSSGKWANVGTLDIPVTLRAGANTVKFSNPNGHAPDFDRVTLTQADPLTYGAGYLNIPAALASTVTVSQPALSPAMNLDSAGNASVDTSVIASKAISGVTTIWGSKAISGVSTVYGSKAISGVSTVYGSKAICGSTVWGDKTLCGSSSPTVDLSSVAVHGE